MMLEKTGRYLNPLSDFGFKHLFGRTSNKDVLVDFLNALFEGQKVIVDINYGSAEYAGEYKELKKVFFDILCTGGNGEQFIIEMQRNKQRYFRERCIYYISRLFNEQLPRGESNWNIVLKEVYLIAILEFLLEDADEEYYEHHISLADRGTKKIFYDQFGIKIIELPNFNKSIDNLDTNLDKWIYLFKNMHSLTERPASLDTPVFEKIFRQAELANLTKEERMEYDTGLKAYWDYHNSIAYAKEEAAEEATEKTLLTIANNMKNMHMSLDQILQATGLAPEKIGKL